MRGTKLKPMLLSSCNSFVLKPLPTLGRLALAGMLALSTPGFAHHHDDTAAAIVAGGIVLGAAALAASSHHHHYRDQYIPVPAYYPPAAPFSPARGVICYPRDRACYDNAGLFLPSWTYRVF